MKLTQSEQELIERLGIETLKGLAQLNWAARQALKNMRDGGESALSLASVRAILTGDEREAMWSRIIDLTDFIAGLPMLGKTDICKRADIADLVALADKDAAA